jgi:hypothetical protein
MLVIVSPSSTLPLLNASRRPRAAQSLEHCHAARQWLRTALEKDGRTIFAGHLEVLAFMQRYHADEQKNLNMLQGGQRKLFGFLHGSSDC